MIRFAVSSIYCRRFQNGGSSMSDFKDKCGDVLTGGATGAAAGGSIGAAIGALGGPVTSALGATIGGAIGAVAGLFSD